MLEHLQKFGCFYRKLDFENSFTNFQRNFQAKPTRKDKPHIKMYNISKLSLYKKSDGFAKLP